MNPWDADPLFRAHTITKVFWNPSISAWEFCLDGAHNDGLPRDHPIIPKVGDRVRYWRMTERGHAMIGIRGCEINGQIVEYRTREEYEATWRGPTASAREG